MKPILSKIAKPFIYLIVILVGLAVLALIANLIYIGVTRTFASFAFSINTTTGEPFVKGPSLAEWRDEGFQDGSHAEVIEIPADKVEEVSKILKGENFSPSSFDVWKMYQGDYPLEGDFSWCEEYLKDEESSWINQKALPEKRFILTDPTLKAKSEFKFLIVDLTERKIFECSGSH